jgi:hypothetical protein
MENTATTTTKSSDPAIAPPNDGPDCERVNTVLDQLIEGHAVAEADEDYLYDHATDCSPCFDSIEKQRVFVNFLNQRVARKPIPTSLHAAILARING